jgi:predicted metalloprotease
MKATPLFALPLAVAAFLLCAPSGAAAETPFWAPTIPALPPMPTRTTAPPSYEPPSASATPPSYSGSTSQSYASSSSSSFASDVSIAVRVVERYWGSRIVGFQPVSGVVPYRIDGELMCGSQPIPTQNAAYCPIGDFIAYDVNWSEQVYQELGDAFVFYLLGHEYAHAVQQRLGINYQFTIHQELQADCLAGAYIGDSIKSGDFTLEDGDLDELKSGLFSVADPDDEPWFQEGAHGSAAQRTGAFFDGYERSLDACDLPTS